MDRYTGARQAPPTPPAEPAFGNAPNERRFSQGRTPAAQPAAQPAAPVNEYQAGIEAERRAAEQAAKSRASQLLDKTTQMVRQLAANKLLQNAARIGGTAAFALQPSSLGPPVPQSGPYRGMEMNPNTGRPWTRQELEALR